MNAIRSSGDVGGRAELDGDAVGGGRFFGAGVSYRIVECSRLRRSNARSEPSAPTETKMSVDPGSHATSYTSRSCAMSCVMAVEVSMFHTVHVVSMEEVTTRMGDFSFHEKFVSGAPVVLISAATHQGVPELLRMLQNQVTENRKNADKNPT